jgi:hypothetical protein
MIQREERGDPGVGIEASGRLLTDLQFELWIGDAATVLANLLTPPFGYKGVCPAAEGCPKMLKAESETHLLRRNPGFKTRCYLEARCLMATERP